MELFESQNIIKSSEKSRFIYKFMKDKCNMKYTELFTILASIGIAFGKCLEVTNKSNGIEIRSNYFNKQQQLSLYTVLFKDKDLGSVAPNLRNTDSYREMINTIEMYAEGGMSVLLSEVFAKHYNGSRLDDDYEFYEIDLAEFAIKYTQSTPF